jgi:hypothetical protein
MRFPSKLKGSKWNDEEEVYVQGVGCMNSHVLRIAQLDSMITRENANRRKQAKQASGLIRKTEKKRVGQLTSPFI